MGTKKPNHTNKKKSRRNYGFHCYNINILVLFNVPSLITFKKGLRKCQYKNSASNIFIFEFKTNSNFFCLKKYVKPTIDTLHVDIIRIL